MGLLDKLLKKGTNKQNSQSPAITKEPPKASGGTAQKIPTEVLGKDAGTLAEGLLVQASSEGWSPTPSLKLHCASCKSSVSLTKDYSFSTKPEFAHSKSGQRQYLDEPLVCRSCGADLFHVSFNPTTFKEWLRHLLDQRSPCEQDPNTGFRDHDTGEIFKSPSLIHARTFEELWLAISRHVNSLGDINTNYSFNMIGKRCLGKSVPGLAHFNEKTNELTIIIKDQSGSYWYAINRR